MLKYFSRKSILRKFQHKIFHTKKILEQKFNTTKISLIYGYCVCSYLKINQHCTYSGMFYTATYGINDAMSHDHKSTSDWTGQDSIT